MWRSRAFRAVDIARRRVLTSLNTRRHEADLGSVRTFCVLLGTVKSGGSLLGSMLDAHPNVVLSDEADPMRYVTAGFSRAQLFQLLVKSARREAMKGRVTARRLVPYSLAVPGQWQGRFSEILVIGDSKAGPTTRQMGERPELVEALREVLGTVEDRYVHVIRSPYDPISAMVRRSGRTLDSAVADYAAQCERLLTLRSLIPPDRLLTVAYEDVIANPAAQLGRLCQFLRVKAQAGYLSDCASMVDANRQRERHLVQWTPAALDAVEDLVHRYPFLNRYVSEGADR